MNTEDTARDLVDSFFETSRNDNRRNKVLLKTKTLKEARQFELIEGLRL